MKEINENSLQEINGGSWKHAMGGFCTGAAFGSGVGPGGLVAGALGGALIGAFIDD